MKLRALIKRWAAICSLIVSTSLAFSQGTAFTYQGRLASAGSPVTGLYDFTNALYNASSGGAQAGSTITLTAVPVTNGLFTVLLDFGGVFNGTTYWLQIGVRNNGVGSYVALSPRQELTPTPYAITAENVDGLVSASQLTGTLPAGLLSGSYGNAVNLNNAGNSLSGNGAGLIGLNASSLGSGTVPDARLSPNVALLNANQTFLKTNVFVSGGGAGRLIVSNASTAVDTSLFTGLSFQYDGNFGEGALMSSYNDGTAYLSFYTKAGSGFPVTKQMIIDRYGGVAIDQGNYNNGSLNQNTTNSAGLTFGVGSGEGIASKRTVGGNQWGLDFYTSFVNRMSIANNGFVGIGRQTPITGSDTFDVRSPATAGSYGGMYVDTVGTNTLPFYGYAMNGAAKAWTFLDGSDGNKWELYNGGVWLTVTPSGSVGIGTITPTETLDINGTSRINDNDMYLRGGTDRNHGLGYRASINGGAIGVDGPFLYGFNGGALGTSGPDQASLTWDWRGNVWTSNNLSTASLTVRGGAIQVQGAGVGTSTAAFVQVCALANQTAAHRTTISNPLCDGKPNAILIVTHNYNPGGIGGNIQTHPFSVWYNGSNLKWEIFNDDFVAMAVGTSFNVLIMTP